MFTNGAPRTPGPTELRIAAALVHAVPGACLLVVRHDGQVVRVSAGTGADLDPCAFRSAVASAEAATADPAAEIAGLDFVGEVVDQGGGVYRSRAVAGERWFATLLCPERTRAELTDDPPGAPADVVGAWLVGDRALAVTVVRISATAQVADPVLDEVARWAAARCLVSELESLTLA
ncbi:MAG: hypothetical protein S0880_14765 [Actinomycetota bacterium]|nr:hypothetical protein [Actinomycetota bacterium]